MGLALLTAFAVLGGFLFGYDTGVISGAEVFIKEDLKLCQKARVCLAVIASSAIELVVSVTVGAAAFASFFAGAPMQRYGRRPIIMLASFLYAVGSLVVAAAPGLRVLLGGRIVVGLAVGLSSMAIPVYVAEAAPAAQRGKLVSAYALFIVLGQAVACGANVAAQTFLEGGARWRATMGAATAPAVLQFLGFICLPESPRWLASVGRADDAAKVLASLRPLRRRPPSRDADADADADDAAAAAEGEDVAQLAAAPAAGADVSAKLRAVATTPHLRRIFRVGYGIMVLQQCSGINTVMYYGASVLIMCGFKEKQSVALTAALAAAQGLGVVFSMYLFDRVGRRKLIIPSTFAAGISILAVSYAFATGIRNGINRYLALGGILCYLLAFGLGLSSGPWVVNSEIYPAHLKGLGSGGSTTLNWLANYAVSATFLTLCAAIGTAATFAVLGAICLLGTVWLYVALPETAGKTFEEIEDMFKGHGYAALQIDDAAPRPGDAALPCDDALPRPGDAALQTEASPRDTSARGGDDAALRCADSVDAT